MDLCGVAAMLAQTAQAVAADLQSDRPFDVSWPVLIPTGPDKCTDIGATC